MHRVLIYFGNIFNGIIMIILDVVLDMIYLDRIVKNEKSIGIFEMFFSCFGPFRVWSMTPIIIANVLKKCMYFNMFSYFREIGLIKMHRIFFFFNFGLKGKFYLFIRTIHTKGTATRHSHWVPSFIKYQAKCWK